MCEKKNRKKHCNQGVNALLHGVTVAVIHAVYVYDTGTRCLYSAPKKIPAYFEVHPDCWCVCLCYLHFAPENPEDGEMYLLVLALPGCPGQSPESCKMVVCVCVCVCVCVYFEAL